MKTKKLIITLLIVWGLASCAPVTLITPAPTIEPIPAVPSLKTSHISGWAVYSVWLSRDPVVSQIFLKNLDTDEITELTEAGSFDDPVWSPDGSQIMFTIWTEKNSFDIYVMDKDGKNKHPVVASSALEIAGDWSPDGKKIAYFTHEDSGIHVVDLITNNTVQLASDGGTNSNWEKWDAGEPHWSPDGKEIAFIATTGISNTSQVFIMNADGTNLRPMTDYERYYDYSPVWCPDGSCIIFARDLPKLMLLDVNSKKVIPLLDNIFPPEKSEFRIARSPVRGYITFGVGEMFYAMDTKSREVYPINIQAQKLSLYP